MSACIRIVAVLDIRAFESFLSEGAPSHWLL